MGLLILMVSLFVFSSCSKKSEENISKEQKEQQDKNMEASTIDEKDFTESDEDFTTVDYKEFYDQLAPHGEWVQVKPEDIGLNSETALNKNSGKNGFSLSNLLGIKDAYGLSASVALVYVWKPSVNLAFATTSEGTPVYMPYSNGQWINTDAGWYFKAPTPVEETTSHYGRWVNSPTAGWLWVPGRVWAPAWVDWKQNDTYVSWAPIPPSNYLINGTLSTPVINDDNYVFVNRNYFLEPSVYKYTDVYYDDGSRILVSSMTVVPGIILTNNTIVNRGPDVNIFQTLYGRNIDLVKINYVRNFNDVRYSEREYFVYHPIFKKVKYSEKVTTPFFYPKSYKKYDDWNVNKSEDKEYKKEAKEYRKEAKETNKENKGNDNGNKYKDNDNGKKNKENDNGNKNKGNDNGKKNKGDDNGKKNKGNDNGDKNKGNDNGNKNKGNDNGDKNKGNNNGKGKNK